MNALRIALIVLALAIFGWSGVVSAEEGTVSFWNDKVGYGFITQDRGVQVFAHYSEMQGDELQSITEGQRVAFTVVYGNFGAIAENIRILCNDDCLQKQIICEMHRDGEEMRKLLIELEPIAQELRDILKQVHKSFVKKNTIIKPKGAK